ncbi:hypothetical protein Tco_0477517 [Tanacetum coccineum]
MTGPSQGELDGRDEREETPPPLTKEQIEGHISAMKNSGEWPMPFGVRMFQQKLDEEPGSPMKSPRFQKANETLPGNSIERWTVETSASWGVPEVMKTHPSGFLKSPPELAKLFSKQTIPKTR